MCALSKADIKQCSKKAREDKAMWEAENDDKKPAKVSAIAKKRKLALDKIEMSEIDKQFHRDFDYLNV